MTSSTPSTRIPYSLEELVGRRRSRPGDRSEAAAVSSPSAASPCLRRCITLLTTTFGEILVDPRAM